MGNIRARLVIHGHVQGVFFRDSTRRRANSLNIRGWVKNRPDGTVEVLAEGEEEAMAQFVAWCRKGPAAAEVTRVDEARESWKAEFDSFKVVY